MVTTTLRKLIPLLLLFISFTSFGQKFGFQDVLHEAPDRPTVFCIPNHTDNADLLSKEGITIKYSTQNWLFITATPRWIDDHKKDGSLDDYYFEYAPPVALADTARAHHNVDQVHMGMAPLGTSYTGDGVIVGIIDTGLDWQHEDFIDDNGNTRVLRYWDHSLSGPNSPAPYNYGQVWDSSDINGGTCTSNEESSAHGSSVAGMAVGNGRASGYNQGMAPNANIIIVETNFSLPNWTLTIADGIDYIFKVADTLGMPAVVNLSLGTYLGSHDGNDPAAEAIEAKLDSKPGRIVVSAAGNSGNNGKYHLHHDVSAVDTNFVWLLNNPSAAIAPNTIFFDLWSDQADATFDFAMAADKPSPDYTFRGRTNFHGATSSLGAVIYDTIWSGNNRIATIEVYTSMSNGMYNMQMFVSNVDSTDYLYRFETVGSGSFDLWSGAWMGYNDLVSSGLPNATTMPDIVNYIMPDTLQTIVSSWNCSEKVVSVGNFTNRKGHIDNNLNPYVSTASPGRLSVNSSKGPNRHGVTKPDISAAGDVSITAGPLWLINNPAWYSVVDSNGVHVRNGGTSMASPVIAGIAALYLERCQKANYQGFITDLHSTAYTDGFTGIVPNYGYGYGKADAFALLQELSLQTPPTITFVGSGPELSSSVADAYQWYIDGVAVNGETNQNIGYSGDGNYQVEAINADGCFALSTPFSVTAGLESIGIEQVKVFPNPSSSTIEFVTESTVVSVECVDINGKTVSLEVNDNTCDLTPLAKGTYSLIITTTEGTLRTKIVRL